MISFLILAILPAGLIIAAINDIYEFKIPNWVSIVLFTAYVPAGLALGAPSSVIIEGLLLGCAALTLGFALFAAKFFGGGDAKLLAATAPWIGLSGLSLFLAKMAIAGGALAIFLIVFRKTPALPIYSHAPWLMRLHQKPEDIPYAFAIAAGGLLSFQETPLFQLAFGG